MNTPRLVRSFLAVMLISTAVLAADPSGTWKWQLTTTGGREVETTLKITMKDGKLGGTFQNEFGEIPVRDATFKDGILAFVINREVGGDKFTLKYRGKVEGDTIKGEIEGGRVGGGESARKREWIAKRTKDGADTAKK